MICQLSGSGYETLEMPSFRRLQHIKVIPQLKRRFTARRYYNLCLYSIWPRYRFGSFNNFQSRHSYPIIGPLAPFLTGCGTFYQQGSDKYNNSKT